MIKRKSKLLIILLLVICLFGCKKDNKDSTLFKKEYESFNSTLKSVNIDKNNPFVYSKDSQITELINNKKTFVVFYGSSDSQESRELVEHIISKSKDNALSTIYYVRSVETTLVGYIDGEEYNSSSDKSEIENIIAKVAIELNTCDIHSGGC